MVLFMKCMPWSLIKILGHPNRVMNYSNKKCIVVSTLQSLTGATSTHLVRYYVMVIMYLAPVLFAGGLIGPKNSIFPLIECF
jgi:hypothetical protein